MLDPTVLLHSTEVDDNTATQKRNGVETWSFTSTPFENLGVSRSSTSFLEAGWYLYILKLSRVLLSEVSLPVSCMGAQLPWPWAWATLPGWEQNSPALSVLGHWCPCSRIWPRLTLEVTSLLSPRAEGGVAMTPGRPESCQGSAGPEEGKLCARLRGRCGPLAPLEGVKSACASGSTNPAAAAPLLFGFALPASEEDRRVAARGRHADAAWGCFAAALGARGPPLAEQRWARRWAPPRLRAAERRQGDFIPPQGRKENSQVCPRRACAGFSSAILWILEFKFLGTSANHACAKDSPPRKDNQVEVT